MGERELSPDQTNTDAKQDVISEKQPAAKIPEILPPEQLNAIARGLPNVSPVKLIDWHVNCDVEGCTILLSKLKEILNEEVPNTPPPHDWYGFVAGAMGLVASIIATPFVDPLCIELWRIAGAAALMWMFTKSHRIHRLNKNLKRNKSAIIAAIIKKIKNKN